MNYFDYFTDIEENFVRRRGKHLFLSPKDWALMQVWEERQIPLHIVLRAIDSVFDTADKHRTSHTISSISYCKNEVEKQFTEYQTAQVGKSSADTVTPAFTIDTVSTHIDYLIERLSALDRAEIAGELSAAIARLTNLRARITDDFAAIDAELNDIEKGLDVAILTSWSSVDVAAAEKTVTDQLESYRADMGPDAYQNTHTLMLLKKLREIAGIPRLSLFHL